MRLISTCYVVILSSILCLTVATRVSAQKPLDPNLGGTTYVIAFPDTTRNTYDTRFSHQSFGDSLQIRIYSAVTTNVRITGGGITKELSIAAGTFTVIGANEFPQPIVDQSGIEVNNTLRIESDDPIIVYCYMLTGFGCEAWTPLPVEAWGIQYYAAAHRGEVGRDEIPGGSQSFFTKNAAFSSELLIVSAFDRTMVSIQPNGTLRDYPPISAMLNAGQAYLVHCTVDTLQAHIGDPAYQADLGGTIIMATRPIGVISGNSRAMVAPEMPMLTGNSIRNMLIEWLTPNDMHGREFVYMPTWDSRRFLGGSDNNGKRMSEYCRVYSTDPDSTPGTPTTVRIQNGVDTTDENASTDVHPTGLAGWFYEDKVTKFVARRYRTLGRGQAFMASPGIYNYLGPHGGQFISPDNEGWGGYMTELVPRERWSSFAPYYAPLQPDTMEHFINVVTDTAHRFSIYKEDGSLFDFNRGGIPGTDLCWGTMTVTPGVTHSLEGRSGARFTGFVYGSSKGYEKFSLTTARKKGSDPTVASLGSTPLNPSSQAPAAYREQLGFGYGYPLASTIGVVQTPDSLNITPSYDGSCAVRLDIRAMNYNPVGLRSITLDPDTSLSRNARIEYYDPINTFTSIQALNILGSARALVKIVPVDYLADAKARVVIKDRTGAITTYDFTYTAQKVVFSTGSNLDMGFRKTGMVRDTEIVVFNPKQQVVYLQSIRTMLGDTGALSIVNITPALPVALQQGEKVTVTLRFTPKESKMYNDTLLIQLGCTTMRIPIRGNGSTNCVAVQDLAFGSLSLNQPKTLPYTIRNSESYDTIRFVAPYLTFSNPVFTVAASERAKLTNAVLAPGDSLTVNVQCLLTATGLFSTIATFHTDAPCGRDTSLWTASSGVSSVGIVQSTQSQLQIIPNPSAESATIRYTLPKHTLAVITITNVLGQQVLTQRLGTKSPGTQTETIRTATLSPGMYTVVVSDGSGVVYGMGKMGVR